MPPDRPAITAPDGMTGHLPQDRAIWLPFDPATLVELAREQVPDRPDLPELLARCTMGGWTCAAYVQFVPRIADGGVHRAVFLEADDEDYVVDIDRAGRPLGVELLGVASSNEHASDGEGWRDAIRPLWRRR
jgi:hypothetical protein